MSMQFYNISGILGNCTGKSSLLDCTLGSISGGSKHMKKVYKIEFQTWKIFNMISVNSQNLKKEYSNGFIPLTHLKHKTSHVFMHF